jgi:hypothetical protein
MLQCIEVIHLHDFQGMAQVQQYLQDKLDLGAILNQTGDGSSIVVRSGFSVTEHATYCIER